MSSSVTTSTQTPYGAKTRRIVLGLLSVVAVVASAAVTVTPVAAKTRAATSTNGYAYTGINPCRVEDTRTDGKTLSAGTSINVTVAGGSVCSAVPASATAVVLTTTVTDTTASSYVTVFPTGATQPTASNQNWPGAGSTIAAQVTTGVGTGGQVTVFNFAGSADVVLDIAGYFAAPGSGSMGHYVPLGTPVRIADTRNTFQTIAPNSSQDFYIAGAMTPTGAGVAASILNVTVTNTQAPGFLTITPKGSTAATTSMLNWGAGQTIADRYNALLGSGGYITVFNGSAGSTDVVIDGSGYFADNTQAPSTGSLFTPLGAPTRLLDTRSTGSTLGTNSTQTLQVSGANGIPAGATAVVQNLTVTNTNSSSYLEAYPNSKPLVSDVNWQAGWTIANAATTTLNSTGAENLYNLIGKVDVIVDAGGYYTAAPGLQVTANPASVPASHTAAASSIVVTATDSNGNPIPNDPVALSLSGAACTGSVPANNASLAATGGTTGANGQFTTTYTSSDTPGACTVNAQEAKNGQTGNVTITQTAVKNNVAVTCNGVSNTSLPANGVATTTCQATVTNGVTAAGVNADTVTWSLSGNPAGSCGSVSPTSGTTNSSGQSSTTYTASTTVGFCTVTATESATGNAGKATIDQTVNPTPTTSIAEAASPASISANGTSTSTITVQVCTPAGAGVAGTTGSCTAGNTAVAGDLIHLTMAGSASGACGTLSATDGATNASGTFTATYTSSTNGGTTCTITAQESNGGQTTSSAVVTQTAAPNSISASANPSSIPADGSTSAVTVTVKNVTGAAVAGDVVTFGYAGSPAGACGTISPNPATTNSSGVATGTYTGSTTAGFCNITASDASTGSTTFTITQRAAGAASITATANPSSVPANGTSTSTITATVKNASGNPVSGDQVNFTTSASPAGSCGAISAISNAGQTNASGQVTATYTSTTTVGTCTINVAEANGGNTGSTSVTQTAVPNNIVSAPSNSSAPANGTSTIPFTVTVTKGVGGANVSGDTVSAAMTGNPSAACGSISPTSAATASNGQATFTYTVSTTVGFCAITFTEAGTNASTSSTVAQTSNPTPTTSITLTPAGPTTVSGNGTSTVTFTATVCTPSLGAPAGTCAAGNLPVAGDLVHFFFNGSSTNCGTLGAAYVTTNASGQAQVTYTSKLNTTGATTSCTVQSQEANGGQISNTSVVNQTTQPNAVAVSASPAVIASNGTQNSTITITVTNGSGAAVAGNAVTVHAVGNPGTTCTDANLSTTTPAATNGSGQTTVTLTPGTTPGFCTITATEALGGTGNTTVRET